MALSEDQLFQLVALLSVALFIGAGVLPLPHPIRRLAQWGAALLVIAGILAALAVYLLG
jgi:hypothetical protein